MEFVLPPLAAGEPSRRCPTYTNTTPTPDSERPSVLTRSLVQLALLRDSSLPRHWSTSFALSSLVPTSCTTLSLESLSPHRLLTSSSFGRSHPIYTPIHALHLLATPSLLIGCMMRDSSFAPFLARSPLPQYAVFGVLVMSCVPPVNLALKQKEMRFMSRPAAEFVMMRMQMTPVVHRLP